MRDFHMPLRDGFEVMQESIAVGEIPPEKFILITGSGISSEQVGSNIEKVRGLGVERALRKPFKLEEIMKVLEN